MRVLMLSTVLLLCGCGLFGRGGVCKDPTGYQGSAELPTLQVPTGIEPPSTKNLLKIPAVKGTQKRRDDGRCLDEPPEYVVKPATG